MHVMCTMEELMPPIGTSVPSPSVLSVLICQSESTLHNIGKLYSDAPSPQMDFDNPFDFCDDTLLVSKTHLLSISDDGKIWNWLITAEGAGETQKDDTNSGSGTDSAEVAISGTNNGPSSFNERLVFEAVSQQGNDSGSKSRTLTSMLSRADMLYKVCD